MHRTNLPKPDLSMKNVKKMKFMLLKTSFRCYDENVVFFFQREIFEL